MGRRTQPVRPSYFFLLSIIWKGTFPPQPFCFYCVHYEPTLPNLQHTYEWGDALRRHFPIRTGPVHWHSKIPVMASRNFPSISPSHELEPDNETVGAPPTVTNMMDLISSVALPSPMMQRDNCSVSAGERVIALKKMKRKWYKQRNGD